MTLKDTTLTYLESHSKEELLRLLKSRDQKQLNNFLAYSNLAEFLDKGLNHHGCSPTAFVERLVDIVEYKGLANEMLISKKEYDMLKAEEARLRSAKIIMRFEKDADNVMNAMLLGNMNKVRFDVHKIANKPRNESVKILKTIAKEHFDKRSGMSGKYGPVVSYIIELGDERIPYEPIS